MNANHEMGNENSPYVVCVCAFFLFFAVFCSFLLSFVLGLFVCWFFCFILNFIVVAIVCFRVYYTKPKNIIIIKRKMKTGKNLKQKTYTHTTNGKTEHWTKKPSKYMGPKNEKIGNIHAALHFDFFLFKRRKKDDEERKLYTHIHRKWIKNQQQQQRQPNQQTHTQSTHGKKNEEEGHNLRRKRA